MKICPPLQALERFASGELDMGESAVMSDHLAACPICTRGLGEVRENLRLAADVRRLMSDSGAGQSATSTPLGLVGRVVDGYTIERVLGSGASSTVYQACRSADQRPVALKVLSTLASGEEPVRRFAHEARILARLSHPGIAQVHASGSVTDDAGSRPYIAMELVDGVPITHHAAQRSLSIEARLALLAQTCEAVRYAHTQGVVHRDIKPGNVLVTRDGEVRVVDFGFARVTGPGPMLSTMHTAPGRIVGTVAYMSPEHVAGAGAVDARSDVYSLGVVGYELLTGRLPHAVSDLSLEAALRTISQSEPPRPSRVEPALAGDVEIILLRALEKRPQDRYPDAGAFAADLHHVRAGEPIGARRATRMSALRKFARSHRPLALGAAAVLAALLLGLVGTTYGLVSAVARSRVAEQRRQSAERLSSLLQQMLREAHPHEAKGRTYTVRQMLDDFSRRFGAGLEDQPLVEAALRTTMGTGYRVLGEYALARPQLERALVLRRAADPPSASRTGNALCELGWLEHDEAAYTRAIALFREAAAFAADDPWVKARAVHGWSDCLRHTGDFADARAQGQAGVQAALLAQGQAGPAEPGRSAEALLAEAHLNLSRIERDAGDYAAAQAELETAMRLMNNTLASDDPRLADALNDRAWLEYLGRDVARAEATVRKAAEIALRTLGPDHPDLGNSKYELGLMLSTSGDRDGAEQLLRESVHIFTIAHGERHPSTFTAQEALARVLRGKGKLAEARTLIESVLAGRRALFGDRNVEVAYALTALAEIQHQLKEIGPAESSMREALDIYRATYKGPHPFIASAEMQLARWASDYADPPEAVRLFRQAIETSERALGPKHADTISGIMSLAALLESRSDWVSALAEYDLALERRGPSTSSTRAALLRQGIGRCQLALGRTGEAIAQLTRAVQELEDAAAKDPALEKLVAPARADLARAQGALPGS